MGIIATVVGVLALLVGWFPFLGLLAIPVAVIGLLLGGVGVLFALYKEFKGIGMPLLGGSICIAASFCLFCLLAACRQQSPKPQSSVQNV
jgi:hypothetical protein